jgi:hypothetical protein
MQIARDGNASIPQALHLEGLRCWMINLNYSNVLGPSWLPIRKSVEASTQHDVLLDAARDGFRKRVFGLPAA